MKNMQFIVMNERMNESRIKWIYISWIIYVKILFGTGDVEDDDNDE